jgi:four helix bundle protein
MKAAETFEELRIWQESRVMVKEVYCTIRQSDRAERVWGFRDQIQRAGVSVMNNIAEGFERESRADFARMLDIAKGSSGELRSMLYVAEDLEYIPAAKASELREDAKRISRGISALNKHLRKERV